MDCSIVFCDVDGTLLNDDNDMLPGTLDVIGRLRQKGIPFVIVSARSPSGIYSILDRYSLSCPIICYSGSHIVDENRRTLYTTGMDADEAAKVIGALQSSGLDVAWSLYSEDTWLTPDRSDPRLKKEEKDVGAQAVQGGLSDLPKGRRINKFLIMGDEGTAEEIVRRLQPVLPELTVVASAPYLVEIQPKEINKGTAVRQLCDILNVPIEGSVAFGDYYNDVDMLEAAGVPVVMGNAPEDLKERFGRVTTDNNSDGISNALRELNII